MSMMSEHVLSIHDRDRWPVLEPMLIISLCYVVEAKMGSALMTVPFCEGYAEEFQAEQPKPGVLL